MRQRFILQHVSPLNLDKIALLRNHLPHDRVRAQTPHNNPQMVYRLNALVPYQPDRFALEFVIAETVERVL
jgi:hypothetical protein